MAGFWSRRAFEPHPRDPIACIPQVGALSVSTESRVGPVKRAAQDGVLAGSATLVIDVPTPACCASAE